MKDNTIKNLQYSQKLVRDRLDDEGMKIIAISKAARENKKELDPDKVSPKQVRDVVEESNKTINDLEKVVASIDVIQDHYDTKEEVISILSKEKNKDYLKELTTKLIEKDKEFLSMSNDILKASKDGYRATSPKKLNASINKTELFRQQELLLMEDSTIIQKMIIDKYKLKTNLVSNINTGARKDHLKRLDAMKEAAIEAGDTDLITRIEEKRNSLLKLSSKDDPELDNEAYKLKMLGASFREFIFKNELK